MRFFATLAATALSLGTFVSAAAIDNTASPGYWADDAAVLSKRGGGIKKDQHKVCLCRNDFDEVTDAYVRMIQKWDDAEIKYLADDFVDRSDSINFFAQLPMGSETFPSKEAFIEHMHVQPDNLPIEVTFKTYNCDTVTLIWTATFGKGMPMRGITVLGVTRVAGYWQIKSIDVEFNSIAYLNNIGGTFAMPTGGPPPSKE